MNIEHIKAFIEVATTGSFQQAAENMHVTQSTMSARIKGLEDSINRKLFIRKRTGVVLTRGGTNFFRYAVTVVKTWERARAEIAMPDSVDSLVGIGIQLNHWEQISPKWQEWMSAEAPKVAAQIKSDYSDRLMNQLRSGLLDVAIVYDPQKSPEVEIERYKTEKLVLVSSQPSLFQGGKVDNYIFIDWGEAFRADHNRIFVESPNQGIEIAVSSVALSYILKYGGSGYFIESEILPYIQEQLLFRVDDSVEMYLSLFMAYNVDRKNDKTVKIAIEGLKAIRN